MYSNYFVFSWAECHHPVEMIRVGRADFSCQVNPKTNFTIALT
jgi:hypothetical protein